MTTSECHAPECPQHPPRLPAPIRHRITAEHEYTPPRVVPITVTAPGPGQGPDAETTAGTW